MNDMIEHETIRKEPPVYSLPIEIIHEDDNLLIINKPPSIPVNDRFFFKKKLKIFFFRFMFVDIILLILLQEF